MKHQRTRLVLLEDAVQHECVDVDVQIERPAEPLKDGHRTPTTIGHIVQLCTTTQPPQHRTHEDGDDRATQVVIPRQPVAQAIRQTQDPLPFGGLRNSHRSRGPCTKRRPADPSRRPYSETVQTRQPATRSAGSPETRAQRTGASPRHPAGSRLVCERSRSAPARSCGGRPRPDAGVHSARTGGPRAGARRGTCHERRTEIAASRNAAAADAAVSANPERHVVGRFSKGPDGRRLG